MITSYERPRLREDLVAEAIEEQGARFIDVIDPDTGNAYRFYDVEYSLACAMDGERDLAGLARWAQEELGIAPSPNELKTVISTLGELGYLDATATDVRAPMPDAASLRPTPPLGIEVELGHYQAGAVVAQAEPPVDLELGAAGARAADVEVETPDVPLGPAGILVPSLPTPAIKAEPTPPLRVVPRAGTDVPHPAPQRTSEQRLPAPQVRAEPPARASESPLRAEPPQVRAEPPARASESPLRAEPPQVRAEPPQVRAEPPQVRAVPPARASEPHLAPAARISAPRVAEPGRAVEPSSGETPLPLRPLAPAVGASDPSLNLSLPIRPDDVKEAVRASREMRSVDVPSDLMEALEAAERASAPAPAPEAPEPAPAASSPSRVSAPAIAPRSVSEAARASASMPSASVLDPIAPLSGSPLSVSEPISPPSVPPLVPVPRGEPRPEYPKASDVRPALAPAPRDLSAPVAAVPLPEPARRSNLWLVVVLVLAILGVVGFGVWKFVLNKPVETPVAPTTGVVVPPPIEAPPPTPSVPAPITAKLSLIKPPAVSVKMPTAGSLQTIVADGTVVSEAEPIARIAGGKGIDQQIAAIKSDLEKRYPADVKRIEANLAAAAGNASATARYQSELNNRKNRIAQRTEELKGKEAELAKLMIAAKVAGKITVTAKSGARLAADAEIASIEPDSYLSGAADLGSPVTASVGDPITLKLKDGESTTCKLENVQGNMVSFRCPVSEGFVDGVEVEVEKQ